MADLRDPPSNAVAVTPSDSALLPAVTTNLAFANSGAQTLTVTMAGTAGTQGGSGAKVTFTSLPSGMYPMRVVQVWSTGTSVTSIVALF